MSHWFSIIVVTVVVALHEAVTLCYGLVSHDIFCSTVPSFCPVERIVSAVLHDAVVDIGCSAEELYTVIRAVGNLDI